MPTENRMGAFISEMRKQKGFTQKQLADQLSVTDKAISKWERGMGYPDITILTKLADCLGISTNELLSGVREDTQPDEEEPQALVRYTLEYADGITEDKHSRRLRMAGIILSISLLTAALICMICDLSINGRFTWVIYPVSAILYSWLVLTPPLMFRRQRFFIALLSASIFILPFLLVLCTAMGGDWFFPLAVPIALSGAAWLWIICLTAAVSKNGWFAAAAASVTAPLIDLCIDVVVGNYTGQTQMNGWNFVEIIVCLLLAAIFFFVGKARRSAN